MARLGMLSYILILCESTPISVFAAEPAYQGADDLCRALGSNSATPIPTVSSLTMADGLRTPVGTYPWSIITSPRDDGKGRLVRGAYAVSEREISRALRLVLERMKMVVEPSAVVGLAVVLFCEEFRALVEKEAGQEGWDIGVVFTPGRGGGGVRWEI